MDERLGFTAASMEELTRKLKAIVDGNEASEGVVRGRRNKKTAVEANLEVNLGKWIKGQRLSELLGFWVQGLDFDWRKLHGDNTFRRVSLPTYPFDRKRYWFTETVDANSLDSGNKPERIPLAPLMDHDRNGPDKRLLPPVSLTIPALATKRPNGAAAVPADTIAAHQSIQEKLVGSLASILFMKEVEIDLESTFIDMGLDSVIGVEWVQSINRQFGLKIAATKLYDHPNIPAFTSFLEKEISRLGDPSIGKRSLPTVPSPLSLDEILDLVRQKSLDIAQAERLIEELGVHGVNGEQS
jgi:polyketide synthase PksN